MEGCIFCRIAKHEIPVKPVYEDDEVIAFPDANPVAPVHILLIPKEHIPGVMSIDGASMGVVSRIWEIIPKLARELGVEENGFRVVVNSGELAGQSVPHLHFHLLGGRRLGWPPG